MADKRKIKFKSVSVPEGITVEKNDDGVRLSFDKSQYAAEHFNTETEAGLLLRLPPLPTEVEG